MARIIANINGYETPLDLPLEQGYASGNADHYTIDYGNGVIEVGGTAEITTTTLVGTGGNAIVEGSGSVRFENFSTLLDYQATALDNTTGSFMEHVHIGGATATGMTLYASARTDTHKKIKIKWSAKGVKQ